jgi:RNA polymerase sigma-70 factor (ECF subfamily)
VTGGERSDEVLLRAHADGEPDAFAEIVRRHRDRLWAVAIRTTGDREDAADALQDALLSAHRAAARFRGDSAVTTWLHRIVVNACLDRLRRRQAHPTVPLPDGSRHDSTGGRHTGGVEPAAPAPDLDTALVVRDALAQLPTEQRTALVLVDVQGYSVAEVAEIMGVAEGTVKSRCSRGRARLAVLLGHLRPGRAGPQAAPTEPATGQPEAREMVSRDTAGNPATGATVRTGVHPAAVERPPAGAQAGGAEQEERA